MGALLADGELYVGFGFWIFWLFGLSYIHLLSNKAVFIIFTVAKVAVEKATMSFDILFSYYVPENLTVSISIGQRVIIPFGSGNSRRQGIILELHQQSSNAENLKSIYDITDKNPILNEEMVRLVLWMKNRYFCTYYDAVKLVLPTGLNMRGEIFYSISENAHVEISLSDEQKHILDTIKKSKQSVKLKTLLKKLELTSEPKALLEMVDSGIVMRRREFVRQTADATLVMVRLLESESGSKISFTEKQKQVVAILQEYPVVSLKELLYYSGLTRSVVDSLVKKGAVEYYEQEVLRNPYEHVEMGEPSEIVLNVEQQNAFDGLWTLAESGEPKGALLHGVTGSGKTQVFIKLIQKVVEQGRQVIMLVPEIGLTPQAIRIFKNMFGDRVAVLHSGLSMGERLDEYKRIKSGAADIAIGTRSAIFSPFENIGLIIIDEEQEYTYKSERTPRYHATDVARFRCAYHKSLLLLASATPSVETYHKAVVGQYSLFKINKRYSDSGLPPVYIVDMNDEKEAGNNAIISGHLADAIDENLDRGEQTILLLNRRGYNTVVKCEACGEIVVCPNCSIPLTFHKANNRLVCHYCGTMEEMPKTCKRCSGASLKFVGLGTQKAEQQLSEFFPSARVLRMDMDTTMSKFSHERKLEAFRNHEYDIMIGTQMVAKGLDFENVTLVGVLMADQSLYMTDFRSSEKTFSMLTQVVGRCGRGETKGRAYIQTYTPYNEIISMAGSQNYEDFFDTEIMIRKAMLYPPFTSFCLVGFVGHVDADAKAGAMAFLDILKEQIRKTDEKIPLRVLGPSEASVLKVAGKYRYKLIIKCVDNLQTRNVLSQVLSKFLKSTISKRISAFIDMNYYGSM